MQRGQPLLYASREEKERERSARFMAVFSENLAGAAYLLSIVALLKLYYSRIYFASKWISSKMMI